jgi:hypothetical protein
MRVGPKGSVPATAQRHVRGLVPAIHLHLGKIPAACALLAAVAILGACGPDEIPTDTGVKGSVVIGPTCPVIRVGTECPDRPFQTPLEVQQADGRVVARADSDEAGLFQIALPPGEYVLAPAGANPGAPPYASPIPFTVTQGAWTTLAVQYDSGIR